jgi:hypothetical protein
MIRLVEVCEILNASNTSRQKYTLREVYVNPKHVVSLREERNYKQKLEEGKLPEELDMRQQFTRLTLDKGSTGLEIVIIGAPQLVEQKLQGEGRDVLLG